MTAPDTIPSRTEVLPKGCATHNGYSTVEGCVVCELARLRRVEVACRSLVTEAERTLGIWPGAHRSHPFLWAELDKVQAALTAYPIDAQEGE